MINAVNVWDFFLSWSSEPQCWALVAAVFMKWYLCCCRNAYYKHPHRDNEVYFKQIFCYFDSAVHSFSYSSVYLPFAVPISPLCDLPEYRWCWGAKHPLGLQQSQTERSGGGKRRENDKHEHGGSWGQLKIAQRRGGESDGESAGTMMRET